MGRFLRSSLQKDSRLFANYAHRPHLPCDLSLVSGPCIWEQEVRRALASAGVADLQAYALPPFDPELMDLLAAREGLPAACLALAPGADLAIEAVLGRCLEAGDRLGILVPNFPRFRIVGAALAGVEVVEFPSLAELPDDLRLVAVCTPNNPSTAEIPREELAGAIAARPDTLFCIDGVFDWCGSYRLADLVREHDNVVVLKSFSKIGLAGLRLGYLAAQEPLVRDLGTALSPFAVPRLVQLVGREVARAFDRLAEFHALLDKRFAPVQAALGDRVVRRAPVPFYLLETRGPATEAAAALAAAGISVVDGAHFAGLAPRRLRVAIGGAEDNGRLLAALDRLDLI
ncbi:MAG: aminotransferase class I/II-fold pyridoxal phosphate-dependent enzyme [Candidatus Krumholzibacteriia bacterium]